MLIKKSMINDRIYEVLHTSINDRRHNQLSKKVLEVVDKLMALIPEDKLQEYRTLEDNLCDLENQQNNIVQVKTYKQGFTDGLEIALLLLKQKNN